MSEKISRDWEIVQEKAFTSWVNSVLQKGSGDEVIADLTKDLADGIKLTHFLEKLSGKKVGKKVDENPKSKIQMIQNLHNALKFLDTVMEVKTSTSSEDIYDGNKKMILGFLWTLYRKYRIAIITEGDKSSEDGLLQWCKNTSQGYDNVNITNWKSGFRDGFAFLALAHKFDPSAFEYESFANETPEARLVKAFEVAEKTMSIPKLLEAKELCKGSTDERSLLLYTSLYFHAYKAKEEKEQLQNEAQGLAGKLSGLEGSLASEKMSKEELMKQKEELERYKTDLIETSQAQAKSMSDLQSQNTELLAKVQSLEHAMEKLRDQVSSLEDKRHSLKHKLREKRTSLEDERKTNEELTKRLADTSSKLQATETQLAGTTQEKEQFHSKNEAANKRSETEFSGLLVLRQHLDQHVVDMHRWRKLVDADAAHVDFTTEVKQQIVEDLAKEGDFAVQLKYLREKLDEENKDIQKYLVEQDEVVKAKKKKAEMKKSASATAD